MLQVKFTENGKIAYDDGKLLKYETRGSSGFDIRAVSIMFEGRDYDVKNEKFILKSAITCLVKTGLFFGIPAGYEVQIRSRSGLALKKQVAVLNSPGTVDSDYTGEIGVILRNFSNDDFEINFSDRIAQCVLAKTETANFQFVEKLCSTDRGAGGFGSTGSK